jgi:copper(I)-binding protein
MKKKGFCDVWPSRLATIFMCAWSLQAIAAPVAVRVDDAVIRPSEQGTSAAIYLDITSRADISVKGADVPGARTLELRKMVISGETVTMQAVDAIPLEAGKTLKFRLFPGQYHMVMMGIARPLQGGKRLPLTLRLADAKGKVFKVTAQAEIKYPGGQQGPAAPDIH